MKKVISFLLICTMSVILAGCGGDNSNNHEGEVKTPSGSSIQQGKDYKDVIECFEDEGFTNIRTETIEDLITGFLTKDGEVEDVSVGGDIEYSPDEWVPSDTEVIIRYHTFPDKDAEKTAQSEAPEESETAGNSKTITSNEDENSEELESTDKLEEPNDADTSGLIEGNLTVDNCSELAAILSTKDEFDPMIKEFAEKYAGRTIEFDGNTANVETSGDYKTRFNFLIYAGDYSETSVCGPCFQFHDVSYYDLHLKGDNVPDTFGAKLNIHIIATVGSYSESSGIFELIPVSITMR